MPALTFFATCPKTIEDLLVRELVELGASAVKETVAGVRFEADLSTAYRICLWTRFANRILVPVGELPCATPDELLEGVRSLRWEEHLGPDDTFAVQASGYASQIRRADYAALVVKDGIADHFRAREKRRPSVRPEEPDLRVDAHLAHDMATISIDLGGGSLHRRGYRQRGVAAPLKENVAAAMLARSRWPEIAETGGPLMDPMCGSGTLLIEGALMAGDVAPGLLRLLPDRQRRGAGGITDAARGIARETQGAAAASKGTSPPLPQGWRGNDGAAWRGEVRAAAERCAAGASHLPAILGFDRDPKAVAAARGNVAAAGFAASISVEAIELREVARPAGKPGLVVVNPPYGERIGAPEQVAGSEDPGGVYGLYRELGRFLHERFRGWRVSVLAPDAGLSHSIGLRAAKINTLYNGPIRCVLAQFELTEDNRFAPAAGSGREREAGRQRETGRQGEAGRHGEAGRQRETSSQARPTGGSAQRRGVPQMAGARFRATGGILAFVNRVRKNRKILERWARREGISCYRIYDADLPEYSVAVDFYEGRWLHVQEYAAPPSIDPEIAAQRLDDVITVLPDAVGVLPEDIFFKRRRRRRRTEQYEKLATRGEFCEVHEGGNSFLVNFTDYLDTGLFLDHRLTRELVRAEAAGKRFLNLFSYTCTATVYAARGGAVDTVSVDSSNTYLRWGRENLTANGIAGQQHRLLRADCWEWLHTDRDRYGLIFMDPPTFSNAKGKRPTLDVQRDHVKLIGLAMARLVPGGTLLFSTNFRRFALDRDALSRYEIEDVTDQTIPRDFARNRRIHTCFRFRR